jgi:DNA-directed RNA polymerase specialized sigma24 family protein
MTDSLDKTLKLLALVALNGRKQKEQIALLDRAGYGQSEIAEVVGSTPKAVSVRLAEIRKDKKGAARRRANVERED